MDFLIDEYFSTIDTSTLDCFRSLLCEASEKQLEDISNRYEKASGLDKECIYDDGVQANMIWWLGEELILISLYHIFEIKLKEIIRAKQSRSNPEKNGETIALHRRDELKKHVPDIIKSTSDFQQINVLRVLVNCFKHSGFVNTELNKLDSSFGSVDGEIRLDLNILYEKYKMCAINLISQIYKQSKL